MLLLALLALVFAISQTWPSYMQGAPGVDYYQFWLVGRAQAQLHPTNIYDIEQNRRIQAWGRTLVPEAMARPARLFKAVRYWSQRPVDARAVASPFLFAVVHAMSHHSLGGWMDQYAHDLNTFHNINMICTVAAIMALCLYLGYTLSASLLFTAVTWYWCWPLANNVIVGQVAGLQLAALAIFLLVVHKRALWADIAGGLILGFLTAFKPTILFVPLFLGLAWAMDGRWRKLLVQAGAALCAAAAAYVVGCLFLHSWTAWADWVAIMPSLAGRTVEHYNFALARVVYELTGWSVWMYLMLLGIALMLFILWKSRPSSIHAHPAHRDYLIASIGCLVGILVLPKADMNYYLLALPLLIFLLRPGTETSAMENAAVMGAMLCLFAGPFIELLHMSNHFLGAALFICGAMELLFVGLRTLERTEAGCRRLPDPAAAPPVSAT